MTVDNNGVVTFEPEVPVNWPDGHVNVTLTDDDHDECIKVRIHGVDHYLHSTTAAELYKALGRNLRAWDRMARDAGALGVDLDE